MTARDILDRIRQRQQQQLQELDIFEQIKYIEQCRCNELSARDRLTVLVKELKK